MNDFLEIGASVTSKDADGRAYLHLAARGGKHDIVPLLLLSGSDPDAMDGSECTPLFLAVRCGHVAAALALLAAGADAGLRCSRHKETTLHEAAEQGNVEILRALIEHGADVDAAGDPHEFTALHRAASKSNIESRCRTGGTPLRVAANFRDAPAMLTLAKHGAEVNTQDNNNKPPLSCVATVAGNQGAPEIVDFLSRLGADETVLDHEGKSDVDVPTSGSQHAKRMTIRSSVSSACGSYWRTLRSTGYGAAGAIWSCAALILTYCS